MHAECRCCRVANSAVRVTVCAGTDGHEAAGHGVHQLPDDDDVAVAPQLARRDRLQRVRPLLQAAQHQPTARHEEGLHTGASPPLSVRLNYSKCTHSKRDK